MAHSYFRMDYFPDFNKPIYQTEPGTRTLRSDCPPFCKPGCTAQHHELLQSLRKVAENEVLSLEQFKEMVAKYYGGETPMKPEDLISDPAKHLKLPLLHWVSLMGKVSAARYLVQNGHDPGKITTPYNRNVLHTMVRWMYNFDCTHGRMDLLMKRFAQMLEHFLDCVDQQDIDGRTPLHICADDLASISLSIRTSRNAPVRRYQFMHELFKLLVQRIHLRSAENSNVSNCLDFQDNVGNTVAHLLTTDRMSFNLIRYLEEYGANIDIANKEAWTVRDVLSKTPPSPIPGTDPLAQNMNNAEASLQSSGSSHHPSGKDMSTSSVRDLNDSYPSMVNLFPDSSGAKSQTTAMNTPIGLSKLAHPNLPSPVGNGQYNRHKFFASMNSSLSARASRPRPYSVRQVIMQPQGNFAGSIGPRPSMVGGPSGHCVGEPGPTVSMGSQDSLLETSDNNSVEEPGVELEDGDGHASTPSSPEDYQPNGESSSLQSPHVESSENQGSGKDRLSPDVDAFFTYLQERGSVDDFLVFAKEKRSAIEGFLESARIRVNEVTEEISDKQKDIMEVKSFLMSKEEELKQLRSKLSKLQYDVMDLHKKKKSAQSDCLNLEKRIKALDDQSALFQNLTS